MTAPRRQLVLLGALAVALILVLYWSFGRSSLAPSSATQAAGPAQPSNETARAGARQDLPVTDVRLDALKRQTGSLGDSERNPFRFRPKAAPPSQAARQTAPPPIFAAPPVPSGPPPPPPIPLKYVGLLGVATQPDRVAVLADPRGNPSYGKEGEIVDGRYRILRIAADSVDIAYADGRGRQTLRLTPLPQ